MPYVRTSPKRTRSVGQLVITLVVGGVLLVAGRGEDVSGSSPSQAYPLTPTGQAQLVSFEPFEGQMCPLPQSLDTAPLYSRYPFASAQSAAQGAAGGGQVAREVLVDRAPSNRSSHVNNHAATRRGAIQHASQRRERVKKV